MIKLKRSEKPLFLTDAKVIELTNDFKSNNTSVWNIDLIKTPLLESSHGKCAYCECSLTAESNYMEVEHFEDKKNNSDKVVEWSNLLPSCKKCNGFKSTHDVNKDPIINPYDENPKAHLAMRLYRLRGKTPKGITTIDITQLNHTDRLVKSRFEIGEKIHAFLDTAYERLEIYLNNKSVRNINRLSTLVEALLSECQSKSIYAASTATMLVTDDKFHKVKDSMENEGIWTEDLKKLFENAELLVLDIV